MRASEKPLPGDLVIRPRHDGAGPYASIVFVITQWPDADAVVAGPYQSFGYALRQARSLSADWRHPMIWRDHATPGQPERLEDVST